MNKPDIKISNHGNVFMVEPVSKKAQKWVKSHLVLESWQWLGKSFAVEHGCIVALAEGMTMDGLRVA